MDRCEACDSGDRVQWSGGPAIDDTQRQRSRIGREYTRLARDYDARWTFYVDATLRATQARLALSDNERLLDIGCGTGALLQRLAAVHPAARLTGVDPVPAMLDLARRKLGADIALYDGWADALPFDAGRFDIVVSCSAFHYILRPAVALREIRRVLRPGGRLVITDWCGDYPTCRALTGYLRLSGRAKTHAYRTYELRRLAEDAGFEVRAMDRYRINWFWGLMTATLCLDRSEPAIDAPV